MPSLGTSGGSRARFVAERLLLLLGPDPEVSVTDETIPDTPLAPGEVRRVGRWAVGVSRGEDFAVSRRCRHQLADLSEGHVDADGCLVCPWHHSRYDTRTGAMVDGPQGFLFYRGKTPGYSALVLAYAKHLKLRVGRVVRRNGRIAVENR
jgi:nitrite reductase/ring-hydroxylating ferredoxin subunit